MKSLICSLILLYSNQLFCQNKIGINVNPPEFLIDARGTDDDLLGGDLQLATPSANHFLRFFSGRGFDPKPFLLFSNQDTFRIASSQPDFGKFTELLIVDPEGNVGIRQSKPIQKLDVNGKIKIGDDGTTPSNGTMRYNSNGSFEGYSNNGWVRLDNGNTIYQNQRLKTIYASITRNEETAWGDTITIPEDGNYLFYVSAYFSSTINEQYASGSPDQKYDNRGRLKIYINGVDYKLLECGNGIVDKDGGQIYVSFAPGTRSFLEVITFQAGDKISLTKNMQAVPALTPNLSIPDLWVAQMDAFYIQKL